MKIWGGGASAPQSSLACTLSWLISHNHPCIKYVALKMYIVPTCCYVLWPCRRMSLHVLSLNQSVEIALCLTLMVISYIHLLICVNIRSCLATASCLSDFVFLSIPSSSKHRAESNDPRTSTHSVT